MDRFDLIKKINSNLCYKPGYKLSAVDWSIRHAQSILVRVLYRTYDYSKRFAPEFSNHDELEVPWYFCIVPAHYDNELDFWRAFFSNLQRLEEHENREAFRLFDGAEWHGPFNPHEPEGQKNFGNVAEDLHFGDLSIEHSDVVSLF